MYFLLSRASDRNSVVGDPGGYSAGSCARIASVIYCCTYILIVGSIVQWERKAETSKRNSFLRAGSVNPIPNTSNWISHHSHQLTQTGCRIEPSLTQLGKYQAQERLPDVVVVLAGGGKRSGRLSPLHRRRRADARCFAQWTLMETCTRRSKIACKRRF